jgi:hypothetical protein
LAVLINVLAVLWCGRQFLEITSFFSRLEIRVFFFAISAAVTLHVLTPCIISQQHTEQMALLCVGEGAGSLMVWETVPRNYFFIFFSPLEVTVFFLYSLIAQTDLCISLNRRIGLGCKQSDWAWW